jgi:hypothetical protein
MQRGRNRLRFRDLRAVYFLGVLFMVGHGDFCIGCSKNRPAEGCLIPGLTECPLRGIEQGPPIVLTGPAETVEVKRRNVADARQPEWPSLVQKIAKRKNPNDRGVGDTLERLFAQVGGRVFKRVMERLGVDCGCGDRQTWLNENYAYPPVWIPTTETIPTPTSKRLIITIAVGDKYGEILELSRPLMEAYAKKCGADFVALTNATQRWWGLEKFRVKQFQKHYDRTIFFDADLLIKPETPDLFEIVDPARIGIHNDNPYNPGGNEAWLTSERSALLNSQGVQLADYSEPVCQNTGVVVCSRGHDIWNGMKKPFPMKHCDEQFWIEHQAQRYPIQQLTYKFNNQFWFGERFRAQNPSSFIIHFSGCAGRDRLGMMKDELKLWNV